VSPVSERSACKTNTISGEMLSQRHLHDSFALFRFVKMRKGVSSRGWRQVCYQRASPQRRHVFGSRMKSK